jgi:hypothetical protein
MISKIISSKISIYKLNYKNKYLYLTLGCKGLENKYRIYLKGSQYHAVVHGNLNIKIMFITIVLKTCTITEKNTDYP